ncbi:hypothetical protein [Coleofasciculus sp. FACHB-1120]|uniref:hypothetical protein n=1 Tax=Coleofasciculus sp. FACHB-1120 TaxID=2692783 RepID=UPI0016880432|nr:hypothetical protein [Coleofasciculus sp. FACHB-1120]MBD2741865.1 hypothetical protein [Coleofasciculus sp. FACHB-1120]
MIYRFLVDIVQQWPPEAVLQEFKQLFIYYTPNAVNTNAVKALSDIIFANNEEEFTNTLKRSCYILINNWETTRSYNSIKELILLFGDLNISRSTLSPSLSKLRLWLSNFIKSQDYQDLKIFVARYEEHETTHWSHRYTSYLLVPQYANLKNPVEQREAARALSQELKDRFKFDLAMYTARSQSAMPREILPKNPTALGDEVLRLIKTIVAKRGPFSYTNLANIFVQQTQELPYKKFKQSLQNYLIFSVENRKFVEVLKTKLAEKLDVVYENHHEEILDEALLLRTCNRVIEYLTTENHREPSPLFILLMSQGHPLTLVIVLLKILLICKNVRTHLETCIAELIKYYMHYPEEDCKWVVNFFEIFHITFAIYAENVQYNLIKMNGNGTKKLPHGTAQMYRVFSQLKFDNNIKAATSAIAEVMSDSGLAED